MAKALGKTPAEEHKPGLHKLAEVCHPDPDPSHNSWLSYDRK
jgi:hypothetical protein